MKVCKIGYISTNVVPCCTCCNRAKSDMNIEEFKEWISKVHKYFVKGTPSCL